MALTGLKLRCPTEDIETIRWLVTSVVTRGQLLKLNDVVCIAMETVTAAQVAAGNKFIALITAATKVVVTCAAAATAGYAQNEKVYFDDANDRVTESASGNTLCGTVNEASSVGDTEIEIKFDGRLGIVS